MKEYIVREIEEGMIEEEEIIRCKDCKWYDRNDIFKNVYGEDYHLCVVSSYYVGAKHYCATGKRREQ